MKNMARKLLGVLGMYLGVEFGENLRKYEVILDFWLADYEITAESFILQDQLISLKQYTIALFIT